MNKSELIGIVAEKSGITKKDAERVVNATLDTIAAELKKGEKVQLSGFGIFEVKDDDSADLLKSRIIWGADGGIENVSDIMKTLGEQDAPDFIVSGDLRRSADIDGYPVYRLRLSVYNLKTGKVVWEGIQTKVSL
jgi:hypothetical protein